MSGALCRWRVCWLGAAGLVLASLAAMAQPLRDPTQPPVPGSAQAARHTPLEGGLAVLRRGGVLHLVHGGRLYTPGQTVAGYTIERLSETEVWLRKGRTLYKEPLFNGVQRAPVAAPAPP